MSALQKYFLAPRPPTTAAGFIDDSFTVVNLRRARGRFAVASSAVTQLPAGLISPVFDAPNIQNPRELTEIILQTAEAAGLANKRQWSIALPEGAARSLVITLESKPASRSELAEILSWKIERVIASPVSKLRISRQRLSRSGAEERYLVTVAHDEVLAQYESVFEGMGWRAGLLLPKHLGEVQWLLWDSSPGDKLLISTNLSGFTSVVMRNGEPALIRTYACDPDSLTDELHRFALYYRDRLTEESAGAPSLSAMLVLGDIDHAEAQRAVQDATDCNPRVIDPAEFGFALAGEPIQFDNLAGPAGLATIAWQ